MFSKVAFSLSDSGLIQPSLTGTGAYFMLPEDITNTSVMRV